MAVNLTISVDVLGRQTTALDLGTSTTAHRGTYPGTLHSTDYATGTGDNQQDLIWSDTRTAAASADTIDLAGSLAGAHGGTVTFVEVRGIYIKNKATAAASTLLVGAGSNPAFSGLFGATGDIIKVPASGCFLWHAPLDGGGLAVTAGTGDILTIDPGAATVTYDVIIWGASA